MDAPKPEKASPEAKYLSVNDKAPRNTQLDQASATLNIDLNECREASLEDRPCLASVDAEKEVTQSRYEFALRWLLKSLSLEKKQPTDHCLSWKSWALLQELLRRCTALKVATILKNSELMACVERALCIMRDQTATEFEQVEGQELDESTRSLTAADNDHMQGSRKRKRGAQSTLDTPLETSLRGRKALFVCVCGVVRRLMILTKSPDAAKEEAAVIESLEHTLSLDARHVATILGSGWYLASDLMQGRHVKWRGQDDQQSEARASDIKVCQPCLATLTELWDISLRRGSLDKQDEFHRAFCADSLIPCLQFLRASVDFAQLDFDLSEVTRSSRQLLISHVLLPYRQEFNDQRNQSVKSDRFSTCIVRNLVKTFLERRLSARNEDNADDYKTRHHTWNSLLSLLFTVAVESQSRQSQRQCREEDPWLERLLLDLVDVVGALQSDETDHRDRKYRVKLIRFLLETCADRRVKLSINTLQQLLDVSSGLAGESKGDSVEWTIIGYCLAIDPDVFIVPQRVHEGGNTVKRPNIYLAALLKASIVNVLFKDVQYVTVSILLPLLNAFATARDIPRFFNIWSDQLHSIETRVNASEEVQNHTRSSPWQDEALFSAASSKVDLLTTGQMQSLISNAQETHSDSARRFLDLASATTLSCIFAGVNSESNINSTEKVAINMYKRTAALVDCSDDAISRNHTWRLLAALVHRWSLDTDTAGLKLRLLDTTAQMYEDLPCWTAEAQQNSLDYREHYEAFRFLLAAPDWQKPPPLAEQSKVSELVHPMHKLMEKMVPFCESVENDIWGRLKLDDVSKRTFKAGGQIKSIEALYLACAAHFLSTPRLLSVLKDADRLLFVEQIYDCALYQWRSTPQHASCQVSFDWPWQQLLKIFPLIEDVSSCQQINTFLVERYLKASSFGEIKYLNVTTPDYQLAFEGLCHVLVEDLDQAQRNRLADRVLDIIMLAELPHIPDFTNHFVFFDKLLCHPSKAMAVFNGRGGHFSIIARTDKTSLLSRLSDLKPSLYDEKGLSNFYKALRLCIRYVIKFLLKHIKSDTFSKTLQEVVDSLDFLVEPEADGKLCRRANSIIISETLSCFFQHRKKLEKHLRIENDRLQRLRLGFLGHCLYYIRHVTLEKLQSHDNGASFDKSANIRLQLGLCLEYLASAADVLWSNAELNRTCRDATTRVWDFIAQCSIDRAPEWTEIEETFGPQYLAVRLMDLELEVCASDERHNLYLLASSLLNPSNSSRSFRLTQQLSDIGSLSIQLPKERIQLIAHLQDSISKLEPSEKAGLLSQIPKEDDRYEADDQGSLYLIRSVILTTPTTSPPENLQLAISQTINTLLANLPHLHFPPAILALQTLTYFLQTHTSLVLQFHIDIILPTIQSLANRIAKDFTSTRSANLYLGCTRLLTALLRSHRARLSGRYGLLLPTLQSLLRCFFTPHAPLTLTAKPIPSSFTPSSTTALTTTHASAYARIILLLCDPSPSSVRRHHRHSHKQSSTSSLNDDVKAAKEIIGSHIPPLLESWVIYTLEGAGGRDEGKKMMMDVSVRDKLMPGIWAAMDTLGDGGRDVLRNRLGAGGGGGRGGGRGEVWGRMVAGWRAERGIERVERAGRG